MQSNIPIYPLREAKHITEEEIAAEQQVIELSKRDSRAFGKIYDRYYDRIFHFIYRRTDDETLAADLCSQTFLKALQNLRRYEFRGIPFSAWLYRIAANEINKHFYKRHKIFSIEKERVMELLENESHTFSEEHISLLLKTLNEMPTEIVEVLELRFFESKGFKEIAYILNIGESAAKMRLYRAVEKLREHFNVNWKA